MATFEKRKAAMPKAFARIDLVKLGRRIFCKILRVDLHLKIGLLQDTSALSNVVFPVHFKQAQTTLR